MAIFHKNGQIISKSRGRSAVAAAAYRSGSKIVEYLLDSVTGIFGEHIWDYRKKGGVVFSQIFAPDNAPDWVYDREQLWNKVTAREKRKDGQLSREFDIALPIELTKEENIDLIKEIAHECFVKHGMIADVNLHLDNPENPHAHVMLTMRDLLKFEDGNIDFGLKNRAWNKKNFLKKIRKQTADVINKHLELYGFNARVSHLSHKERGIDLEPTMHVGPAGKHMGYSERKNLNAEIIKNNAKRICESPELIIDKLSINRPVFTKEEIVNALSKALLEVKDEGGKVIGTLENNENIELLNKDFNTDFMIAYSKVISSNKLTLIIEEDIKGQTLYTLTKRLELEKRFEEKIHMLNNNQNHCLNISEADLEKLTFKEQIESLALGTFNEVKNQANKMFNTKLEVYEKNSLSQEQKQALLGILNGKDISILEGIPGAGKTFIQKQITKIYEKAGYNVIGLSQSSAAALQLEKDARIESKNTALWRKEWQEAKGEKFELALRSDYYKEAQYKNNLSQLDDKTVLIIDEASMSELANMDYFVDEVIKGRSKVIFVGDNNQYPAVGIAGALKKAVDICGSNKLTEVRRQQNPLHVRATKLLSDYKISEALEIYKNEGAFRIYSGENQAETELVTDYVNNYLKISEQLKREDLANIKSVAICAHTNEVVNSLNNQIREKLKSAGVIKGFGKKVTFGGKEIELCKGEQIVFIANDNKLKIYNGEVGTVLSLKEGKEKEEIEIKLLVNKADGSKKILNLNNKKNEYTRLDYGYAVTGYKLQGSSCDNIWVFLGPGLSYESFLVMMSRHRHEVKVYGNSEELELILKKRLNQNNKSDESDYEICSHNKELVKCVTEVNGREYVYYKTELKEIDAWFLGLIIGVSKRANLNFAKDYLNIGISDTDQVIKEYLELKKNVIAASRELDQWGRNQKIYTGKRLDPWIVLAIKRDLAKEKEQISKDYSKTIDPWRAGGDDYKKIWEKIPEKSFEQLEALKEKFHEYYDERAQRAKIICDNYHGWYDKELSLEYIEKDKRYSNRIKGEETNYELLYIQLRELEKKLTNIAKGINEGEWKKQRGLKFKDIIIPASLNYETIRKHAGYSAYGFYAKSKDHPSTLYLNQHYVQMMLICKDLLNISNSEIIIPQNVQSKLIDKFTSNYNKVNELITENNLKKSQLQEELKAQEQEKSKLLREISHLCEYRDKLVPEFIKRVYRTSPEKIINNWNELIKKEGLDYAVKKVKFEPQILGWLNGFGLGALVGLSKKRIDAIVNIEQLPKRLKEYEESRLVLIEANNFLKEHNYEKREKEMTTQLEQIEKNLPNKTEEQFINAVSILKESNKEGLKFEDLKELMLKELTEEALIDYYNEKQIKHEEKLENKKLNNQIKQNRKKDLITQSAKKAVNKENISKTLSTLSQQLEGHKNQLKRGYIEKIIKSNTYKTEAAFSFKEVKEALSSHHYERIFGTYSHMINKDGKVTKKGMQISCGSLGMNLKDGRWNRFSTGQSGDIFHFVEEAAGVSTKEALEIVADIAGLKRGGEIDFDQYRQRKAEKEQNMEQEVKKPNDSWEPFKNVPNTAPKFDPGKHLTFYLKENNITAKYTYKNDKGELLGFCIRFESKESGKKQVLPVSYCYNEALKKESWRFKGFIDGNYKPIYGAEKINLDRKPILIVEGEKAADKAQGLLPEYSVLSWMGGCKAAGNVDWSKLKGREIVIWPDNDNPGFEAALIIAEKINKANDHIGLVTIVNPKNLGLPEKWDLADTMPKGINSDTVKETIEQFKARSVSINYTLEVDQKLENKQTKTPTELEQAQRILWQARSLGKILNESEIRVEVDKIKSWEEKLNSQESHYYAQYIEARGIGDSNHEFLNLNHALYRDTLMAIAKGSKLKGKENLDIPDLMNFLHSEYLSKSKAIFLLYAGNEKYKQLENSFSGHQNRQDLYKIIVHDLALLHKEQNGLDSFNSTYIYALSEAAYNEVSNYRNDRNQNSDRLDKDDKIKISENLHKLTSNKGWWKNLVSQQLDKVNELKLVEEKKLDNFLKAESEIIEKIKTLNPSYKFEELKSSLKVLNNKGKEEFIESELFKTFKDAVLPELNRITQEKQKTKSPEEMIKILEKEKNFCTTLYNSFWQQSLTLEQEEKNDHITKISALYSDKPELLDHLARDIKTISKFGIETNKRILDQFLNNKNHTITARNLFVLCQNHLIQEIKSDIRTLKDIGFIQKGEIKFNDTKTYLQHRMNEPERGHYLKGTKIDKYLTEIHKHQQLKQQMALQKEHDMDKGFSR